MKYLRYLADKIHTTIFATLDHHGKPVTCAIDIMDFDENGLYFLTAKGKSFYQRLKSNCLISLTGIKGKDTLSCKSITIQGEVKEIGSSRLKELFLKNPYMYKIYPTEESRKALTVFCIYKGQGEFFDLSRQPVFREQFSFGDDLIDKRGFYILDKCTNCNKCLQVCPQNCIVLENSQLTIQQEHCLHCGNCYEVCPARAIEKR